MLIFCASSVLTIQVESKILKLSQLYTTGTLIAIYVQLSTKKQNAVSAEQNVLPLNIHFSAHASGWRETRLIVVVFSQTPSRICFRQTKAVPACSTHFWSFWEDLAEKHMTCQMLSGLSYTVSHISFLTGLSSSSWFTVSMRKTGSRPSWWYYVGQPWTPTSISISV